MDPLTRSMNYIVLIILQLEWSILVSDTLLISKTLFMNYVAFETARAMRWKITLGTWKTPARFTLVVI